MLFQRSKEEERVVPTEVKVMAWKKGGRNGVVVRGAGGPGAGRKIGGGTVRIGGRVPWGAEVEYAYRAPGPGVGDSRCRAGLRRHVEATGAGCRLVTRGRTPLRSGVFPLRSYVCGLFCVSAP